VPVAAGGAAVDPRVRRLASAVRGRVLTRGSAGYNQKRLLYNTRFDGIFPLAVVEAAGVEDVRQTVLWAQRNNVRIAARAGGHSYAGYSTASGGVVVDLRGFTGITLNAGAGTARLGAGVLLINMYAALARRGRTIPGGSCPTVGISGLALGGGVGLSARRFGTTSDNISSLQIVTANGRVLTADARRNADLYWACRGGGGGNFGIVTSFTFETHPVDSGAYFFYSFPWSAAADVVRFWQRWVQDIPDALDTILSLSGSGSGSGTLNVFGQFDGSQSALQGVLRPLARAATPSSASTGSADWLSLQLRWAGCLGKSLAQCQPSTQPRDTFTGKSSYVRAPMSARGVATLLGWIGRAPASGGGLIMDSYGGAVNRVAPAATAFVHRNNICSYQYFTSWPQGASGAANQAWISAFYAAMRPFVSPFAYQNYIDPTLANWPQAYYGSNLPRLVAVKRRHDPDNLFRFRQSIPLTVPG
jgi:FAD/FMN-containing dehydrogenase